MTLFFDSLLTPLITQLLELHKGQRTLNYDNLIDIYQKPVSSKASNTLLFEFKIMVGLFVLFEMNKPFSSRFILTFSVLDN